jgi:hypothetical protein
MRKNREALPGGDMLKGGPLKLSLRMDIERSCRYASEGCASGLACDGRPARQWREWSFAGRGT